MEVDGAPDADDGAPAGGSPQGGPKGNKPDGEETVPVARLKAALADQEKRLREEYNSQMAGVRAEIEALKKPAVADQPKRYTRSELTAAVEARQITQEQADAEMDRQLRADASADATRVAHATVNAAQREERISQDITRYVAVAPEIQQGSGHETRVKVEERFKTLIARGQNPEDLAAQLDAIEYVLGPIDSLEKSRSGRASHDPHRESGGGDGGGRPAKKFADTLTPELRDRYAGYIKNGIYKDWAEVEAERKFARPARRRQA